MASAAALFPSASASRACGEEHLQTTAPQSQYPSRVSGPWGTLFLSFWPLDESSRHRMFLDKMVMLRFESSKCVFSALRALLGNQHLALESDSRTPLSQRRHRRALGRDSCNDHFARGASLGCAIAAPMATPAQ